MIKAINDLAKLKGRSLVGVARGPAHCLTLTNTWAEHGYDLQAIRHERCDAFVTGDMNKIQYFACQKCEGPVRQVMQDMVAASTAAEDRKDAKDQP